MSTFLATKNMLSMSFSHVLLSDRSRTPVGQAHDIPEGFVERRQRAEQPPERMKSCFLDNADGHPLHAPVDCCPTNHCRDCTVS